LRLSSRKRSAAPCRRRWARDGWLACKAMKVLPEAWRLLASLSVDDTGLQRRNLAETGTDSECERDETALPYQTAKEYFGRLCFAHRCLGRWTSLSFRASTPRNILLEHVLRTTTKVQICFASQGQCIRESLRACFESTYQYHHPSQRSTTFSAPRTITS
jgi:hypothetical protein